MYSAETDRGLRNAVSILEPDWVMDHGLNFEAIVGFDAPEEPTGPTPATLREHSTFLRVLSRVIYEEAEREPDLRFEADVQREGVARRLPRPVAGLTARALSICPLWSRKHAALRVAISTHA